MKRLLIPVLISLAAMLASGELCADKPQPPAGNGKSADDKPMQVVPKPDSSFFQASLSGGASEMKDYVKMPDERSALPGKDNPRIVEIFADSLRRALNADCVPDDRFIKKNIRLVPAARGNGKEDVAYLSYQIAGATYLIAQNGGTEGRVWVFLRDPAWRQAATAEDAAARVRDVLGRYCARLFRQRVIPLVAAVNFSKDANGIYTGITWDQNRQLENEPSVWAKWFVGGNEVCLNVPRLSLGVGCPKQDPKPDEWFSWEKRIEEELRSPPPPGPVEPLPPPGDGPLPGGGTGPTDMPRSIVPPRKKASTPAAAPSAAAPPTAAKPGSAPAGDSDKLRTGIGGKRAAVEECELVFRAVDLDNGRGVAGAVFWHDRPGAEDWGDRLGTSDKDGYLRTKFETFWSNFYYISDPPEGYQTVGLDHVELKTPPGGHVEHTFYLRRPTLKPAAKRPPLTPADLGRVPLPQKGANNELHFAKVTDMPGFVGKEVTFSFYPGKDGRVTQEERELAAEIYRDGQWVAAAARDEMRAFQKAEPKDKGKIDAMRDIEIRIEPDCKDGKDCLGVHPYWSLYCHLPDEFREDGYCLQFEKLKSCHFDYNPWWTSE